MQDKGQCQPEGVTRPEWGKRDTDWQHLMAKVTLAFIFCEFLEPQPSCDNCTSSGARVVYSLKRVQGRRVASVGNNKTNSTYTAQKKKGVPLSS